MAHIHIPSAIPTRYLQKSQAGNLLAGGLFAVGLIAFLITWRADSAHAWRAYIVNWLLFTSIAMGACMVAVVTWIVKAKWNWSLRRVSIAFVAFLPFAFLLMLPMLTLGGDYFPWVEMMADDPIVQKKAAYLNMPFLVARNVIGFIVLMAMLMYFAANALRPDMGRTEDDGDAARSWWRDRLSTKWLGQAEEEQASYKKMTRIAPAIVMVYALVMSMISIDWIMSLEPHWFSTLFGGWFFMGAFWAGWSVTALTAVLIKRKDAEFDEMAGPQQLWDLGKLMFAFTIFWTYLFWSQYIVIWYGKLPWEQAWVITRSQAPWAWLSITMVLMCFVFPFVALIGKQPKMKPLWLGFVAVAILCGQWVWQYVMLVPAIHHGGPAITFWDPAIGLMFLGLMIGSVRWFLCRFPIVQLWQPLPDPEFLEAEIGLTGAEMVSR